MAMNTACNNSRWVGKLAVVTLPVKPPTSAGILLSYKCTGECRHCMYACSPKWSNRWMSVDDLRIVLEALAPYVVPASPKGYVGINEGLHFTGGEPFLNYELLKEAVKLAEELGYPSVFVETNCYWCVNEDIARERFSELRKLGLEGVLVSANPFVVEHVPLKRILAGLRAAYEVFGRGNAMVYHPVYLDLLLRMGVEGTLNFEDYLREASQRDPRALLAGFNPSILLPMGRLPYTVGHLYRRYPAKAFFGESCLYELTRPWHVHVDCFRNYIPGYCAGISLGDAARLDEVVAGVDLDDKPVLKALATDIRSLYDLAVEHGYRERGKGYVSKCHLCLDIRTFLALKVGGFSELKPLEFYERMREVGAGGRY